MSHHCVDWIPSSIANKVHIFWTLDFGLPEFVGIPKIWVEHGIPDNHVISKKQFHDDVYYLCSNDWTYNELKNNGMKAYHVGHLYLDRTIPDRRNPSLFVYCPQHGRMENHDLPLEWNHKPKTKDDLESLCKEYDCDGYVTSIVDDTQRDLYADLNPLMSNRFFDLGAHHFKKCKYLYENAKVVYTDIMSTFDITAQAHGIEVIGRENQNMPKPYDNIGVLVDGKCCTRILNTINEIINEHN